jgi:curved DNA-binding protein
MDYYNILGVNNNSTPDEIKQAYRKLVKEHHPDRGGDAEYFKKINEAYEVLKDQQKRSDYDTPRPEFSFNSGNININDFHDLFGQFFNQRPHVRKNRDIRLSVSMSLEDVAVGKEIIGTYTLPSGRKETSNFKIPAGVENGEIVKFKGLGDDSYENIDRGDVLVHVKVLPHTKYERDGCNIFLKERINVFDLMIGTNVEVEDLTGATISVNVCKGTQPETILSVANRGLPDRRTGKKGNIFIRIKGYLPEINDPEVLRKLKEIRNEISNSTR